MKNLADYCEIISREVPDEGEIIVLVLGVEDEEVVRWEIGDREAFSAFIYGCQRVLRNA